MTSLSELFFLILSAFIFVSFVNSEVIMEVEFDLNTVQTLPDGFSATDTVNVFLQSKNMKWLRYFNTLASSKPGPIPMRTAHLAFRSIESWAKFLEENQSQFDALFDHFWLQSHRVLWETYTIYEGVSFAKKERTFDVGGGFMYQILYTPIRDQELNDDWRRNAPLFASALDGNSGFLERTHYISNHFQSKYQHMVQYEFSSLNALTDAVYGKVYTDLMAKITRHFREYSVSILTPGASQGYGYYWPAGDADVIDQKDQE